MTKDFTRDINTQLRYIDMVIKDMQIGELSAAEANTLINAYSARLKAFELLMQQQQNVSEKYVFDVRWFIDDENCKIYEYVDGEFVREHNSLMNVEHVILDVTSENIEVRTDRLDYSELQALCDYDLYKLTSLLFRV